MVQSQQKNSRIPPALIRPLLLFILIGCIMVAGCSIPGNKNTTVTNPGTPTITPSVIPTTLPPVTQTVVPGSTQNSTVPVPQKGQLNVSIGDYSAEPPATVFVDNVSMGKVSAGTVLNLTTTTGRHAVRLCIVGACLNEDVIVLPSEPTELYFGDRLKNEVVTGPLSVSIGGYVAELPVMVDNITVGNVSNIKPLNMKVTEGNHNVKVCVGILCENETVVIKFAQPVYLDFGERLKKDMEFSTPTIRIIDTQKSGSRVMVTVEFINPTKKDLSMSATIQVTYSYIAPTTHYREGNSVQGSLARTVKAGNTSVQSLNLTLSGGSAYISEVPSILDSSIA